MFDKIIRFSLKNRLIVLAGAAFILAYGGWVIIHLPVDVFPDLNRPTVTIMAEAGGLPEGYFVTYGGQFESQQKASRMMVLLGALSILGIFLVLFGHFRSAFIAIQIMLNIPMALIGSVVAIYLSDRILSIASMVAFVTLCGIASRNGIMMISHYLHLMKEEGEAFSKEMVIRGSLERLVPVLMTALTAMLALIPLLLSKGEPGKEILYPVAVVIFGGLFSSTLLDMWVTPTIFFRFGRASAEAYLKRHEETAEETEPGSEIPSLGGLLNPVTTVLVAALVFAASPVLGHEGHDAPGGLPPAPHGGKVKEAEHDEHGEKDHHAHGKEDHHEHGKEAHHEHEKGAHDEHGKEAHAEHGKDAHAEHHDEAAEPEFFFEASYKDKELRVFPLVLLPKNRSTFTAVSAQKELSKVSLKIEFPRAKRTEVVTPTMTPEAIVAKVDPKGAFRFIVHISALHDNEIKQAKIQVEDE